jgi:hypothetical protein
MQHNATIERTESLPLTVQEWEPLHPGTARRVGPALRSPHGDAPGHGEQGIPGRRGDHWARRRTGVPDLARINARLRPLTGWCAIPVEGFLPAAQFFHCLACGDSRRPSPSAPVKRSTMCPSPTSFHDVFGHVPLHANPVFAAVLQRLGELGSAARSEPALREVTRLFWFTVEFGLVRGGRRDQILRQRTHFVAWRRGEGAWPGLRPAAIPPQARSGAALRDR